MRRALYSPLRQPTPYNAQMQNQSRTARDCVETGAQAFTDAGLYYGHGADNPLDDALALVRHAAGIDWHAPEAVYDEPLEAEIIHRIETLFERRISERLPVPYLTGEAWFAGLRFKVTPDVLIPRSPLAELILEGFQPWLGKHAPERILDLCTGSGCIAIACARAFPQVQVTATDLSQAALAIAGQNRAMHGLESRMELLEADVYHGLPVSQYDIIVSNPPYVPAGEMAKLPTEYLHEPRMALEAENDGLAIVERILLDAPEYLEEHGLLVVEVGISQEAVASRWPELPLTWLEFERGGEGVFIISAQELRTWNQSISE